MTIKRIVAVGCSHGEFANERLLQHVLKFCKSFKPHYRIDLGDLVDTAAFRSGAKDHADEGQPVAPDLEAGVRWIEAYRPTHICWGNHEYRLVELSEHKNACIAFAAQSAWSMLQAAATKVNAETRPYDVEDGWLDIGGYAWGHGYVVGLNALSRSAGVVCKPLVMAHTHSPQVIRTQSLHNMPSFCVGTLSNIRAMRYARRRFATLAWGHGLVYGDYLDAKSGSAWANLCLAQSRPGTLPDLPF